MLQKEANAVYQQRDEFGDNGALLSAIERSKRLIDLNSRERVPLQWAGAQHRLGLVLWRLGERENGTAKLEEAGAAYREVLKEWTRESVPLDWAKAQNDLGNAFLALGERDGGTAKFQEAAAYREAL